MTLPINPKHPFWSAETGSILKLISPDICLTVSVQSISQPYLYKIIFKESISYHNKKDAIIKIKNEWPDYHETKVEFDKHTYVDFSKMSSYNDSKGSEMLRSSSSNNITPRNDIESDRIFIDSCPPSPSPRNVRRNSIKMTIGTNYLRRDFSDPKSPSDSPRSPESIDSINTSPGCFPTSPRTIKSHF